MIDDADRWDAIHKKTHKPDEPHSQYAEEVEKLFPRKSLVVDMGAGTGLDALYFLKNGHSVIAFDISPFALDIITQKASQYNLSTKLVTRKVDFGLHALPVKDSSVDVVYSRISLNYFGAKQTTKIFKDIYRILKSSGRAFVTLKSPDDTVEMEYLEKTGSIYEPNVYIEGGMLRSRFTQEQLREILKDTDIPGFNIRSFEEDLSSKGDSHHPRLFVNEVTFSK
ncbi:MAG: Methyltransferase type 11 [Microgenomates group bacterium GW2011_GWC1_37_8]|uniref:Methyltransferase type 12 n=1 Tax=Candidatus Woesebacteria bacterium GW2011_GWB1_38_8 TaxID=1618570 RepID=A0A0G0P8V9_9BACT|nr:MAG: Methyltransferase type 11 [Microgenomates group bacterium GW2011_GWC1_37_8]KKQ85741.1 MAG: Methyltransferase type 12 [Candidatus Woesebacteria bacterium GW2011_GWB1_38_8]